MITRIILFISGIFFVITGVRMFIDTVKEIIKNYEQST